MQKSYITIIIEAIIVGILLIIVFNATQYLLPNQRQLTQLFISGAMFHILCEVSGVNIWYAKNYVDILNKY